MEGAASAETTVGGKQTVKVSETDMKKEDPESELYKKKNKEKFISLSHSYKDHSSYTIFKV